MSLAVNPIKPISCHVPETKINSERFYVILKGGSRVSYKIIPSTSQSVSSTSFVAPPPSPGTIVDRKVKIKLFVELTFTGTESAVGEKLLKSGFDAFRQFPISSNINTLSANINNSTVSINMSDVHSALIRYNTKVNELMGELSIAPTMLDKSQSYSDLVGSVKNPLEDYSSSTYSMTGRGAFPYTIIAQTSTTATIRAELTEYLYLSPFTHGEGDHAGFIGVQNLSFTFNWANNLQRIWSHSSAGGSILTNLNVAFYENPQLLFRYITPSIIAPIPKVAVYPYYNVQRYPTNLSTAIASMATGTFATQNIQLQSIPRRIFVFARRSNADLAALALDDHGTDTFFSIEGINVNWDNQAGLLSTATKQDLFQISKRHGCCDDWVGWNGLTTETVGAVTSTFGLCGSVLCFEMSTDIALAPDECPGMLKTTQLQLNVQLKNISAQAITGATLYVVVVSEGTLTIRNNSTIPQIGVASKSDVMSSTPFANIDYNDLNGLYGGDFWGQMKSFGKHIGHIAKGAYGLAKKGVVAAAPYAQKAAKYALTHPEEISPYVQAATRIGRTALMGLGEEGYDAPYGGSAVGGRRRKRAGRPKGSKNKRKRGGTLVGDGQMSRAQLNRRYASLERI